MRIAAAAILMSSMAVCAGAPEPAKPATGSVSLPEAEIAAVSARVKSRYEKGSKYMEGRDLGIVDLPEWKGFPTRKWEYTQRDRDGTKRPATVIMLNPSPERLARWVVRASYDLKGKYDLIFCDALLKHVFTCSGGQFVVRGICLEDMDGDGIHTAYPFRDGVTVKVRGIPGYPRRPLTETESNAALNAPLSDITQFAKRARLQSTQPADWAAHTGTSPVEGAAWLAVVREEYQKAWNADSNPMLTATAKALGLATATTAEKRARIKVLEIEREKSREEIDALGGLGWLTPELEKAERELITEKDPAKIAELNELKIRLTTLRDSGTKAIQKLKALESELASLYSAVEQDKPSR